MSATWHDAYIPKFLPTWRVLVQLGIVPGYWGFCRHREYPPMSESPLTRQGLPSVLADLVRFYCISQNADTKETICPMDSHRPSHHDCTRDMMSLWSSSFIICMTVKGLDDPLIVIFLLLVWRLRDLMTLWSSLFYYSYDGSWTQPLFGYFQSKFLLYYHRHTILNIIHSNF